MVNKERNLRRATEKSIEGTRRDIDKRVDEIKGELEAGGPEAVEGVLRSLSGLKEELQTRFDDIQGMFEGELETGRKEIREHPLLAVSVAVAAGVIVGLLLGKKED